MNSRNPILASLFKIAESPSKIPPATLIEFNNILNELPKISQQQIAFYTKHILTYPQLQIELPERININTPNEKENTLLMSAVYHGHYDLVEILLRAKADINFQASNGDSALLLAAKKNHHAIVHQLIDTNIEPDQRLQRLAMALKWAIKKRNLATICSLLVAKADPNFPFQNGVTPVIYAIRHGRMGRIPPINAIHFRGMMVDTLLMAQTDINTQTGGYSALGVAVDINDIEIVAKLLAAKANPNVDTALPLLVRASQNHYRDIIHLLIDANANPNVSDYHGDTTLHWAAFLDFTKIVKKLIKLPNLQLEITNNAGNTALDEAVRRGNLEIVAILLQQGAKIRKPELLYKFLLNYIDQGSGDVYIAFHCLYQQLQAQQNTTNNELLHKIASYLDKLTKYTELEREKAKTAVDEATQKKIPLSLIGIISEYDTPLERYSMFHYSEIDTKLNPNRFMELLPNFLRWK